MPASTFRVVDLPAPFGPMNATRSPGAIENDSRPRPFTGSVCGEKKSRTRDVPRSRTAYAKRLRQLVQGDGGLHGGSFSPAEAPGK
jgi:hypothetical protein